MSRLRTLLTMRLSEDTAELTQVFDRLQESDDVSDFFVKGSAVSKLAVPYSGNVSVGLGGITAVQLIYVETDKLVTLTINAASVPLRVSPRAGVSIGGVAQTLKGRFLVWTDAVTSIVIANPGTTSADNATVLVVLAGA